MKLHIRKLPCGWCVTRVKALDAPNASGVKKVVEIVGMFPGEGGEEMARVFMKAVERENG